MKQRCAAVLCNGQIYTAYRLLHGRQDRKRQRSHPLDLPLPRYKMKRGNVISSLLLPQPMAVCTSLWIIADKVLCSPVVAPLLSPVSVTSHHSKLTRGLHGWRAHTFLVSYLTLLGAVLGGKQRKPIGFHCANFYTRVPSDVTAAYIDIDSAALISHFISFIMAGNNTVKYVSHPD